MTHKEYQQWLAQLSPAQRLALSQNKPVRAEAANQHLTQFSPTPTPRAPRWLFKRRRRRNATNDGALYLTTTDNN